MKQFQSSRKVLVFNSVLYLVGILIFISGFLPVKKSLQGYSNHDDFPYFTDSSTDESKMKIVFMVVDAMRADFIPSVTRNSYEVTMPFLEELIANGTALPFVSETHSPTVTLPRIKAMMSGTVPAFLDVILNLGATRSQEDSLLYQAHRAKHNILFFGDDTWVKLYQNYFSTYEGTTSFFVNDFIEVDHNVTRHLDKVLNQPNWDWLILHYLGLDHIGHLSGHNSPLIKPKLKEMDNVLKQIHHKLQNENYMIVVTGDHGMTASGSHGGASIPETLTPLIFISKQQVKITNVEHVMQIDIVPTMSVLMGLPIPKNSIGKIIPSVLEKVGLSSEVVLKAIFRNTNQVANVLKVNHVLENEQDLNRIVKHHKTWLQNPHENGYHSLKLEYSRLMKTMSKKMERSSSGYDVYSMIVGFLTVSASLLSVLKRTTPKGMALVSEEMVYIKMTILVPSFIISSGIHFLICVQTSNYYCTNVWAWPVPIILLTYFFFNIIQCSYLLPSVFSDKTLTIGIELFVVVGNVFHVLSLGSSSFVEEEHQTWYFLTTTLVILLFLENIRHMIRSFDVTLELGFLQRSSPGNFAIYRQSLLVKMSYCLGFLILSRVSRSWNQTGNKWAHLPDIGDYLRENTNVLIPAAVMSLVLIFVLTRTERVTQQCCLLLAILGSLGYHLETVTMSGVSANKQVIAWFVYLAILVHTFESIWHVLLKANHRYSRSKMCEEFLSGVTTSWLLLAVLLCRTHNIPLFLLLVLQEKLLQKLVWKEPTAFFVRTSAYLWASMCAFFYQGNSNMISTLDVSAGYVGLSSYQPVIVGFLVVCNTYSGMVYLLLQYVVQLCHSSATQGQVSVVETNNIAALLCIKLLSGTMYLAVVIYLRHHLFIWTVFAPKLLYEGVYSIVFVLFICLILIVARIGSRSKQTRR